MQLNHILIKSNDLEQTANFFTRSIGLRIGFRPPFPFPGKWLYSDGAALIHLFNNDNPDKNQSKYLGHSNTRSETPIDHIALQCSNDQQLIIRLIRFSAPYIERTIPETNEHQVFVQGPEGIKMEMLFRNPTNKQPVNSSI